jgi:hypothetical protein
MISEYAKIERSKMSKKTEHEMVEDYTKLPSLPMDSEVNIDKLGIFNYYSSGRQIGNLMTYSTFTSIDPVEYPVGTDPKLHYMPGEHVAPVIIINTDGIKYKINMLYWFPLIDLHDCIIIKQRVTGERFFPKKIITEKTGSKNPWISVLLSCVGKKICDGLGQLRH